MAKKKPVKKAKPVKSPKPKPSKGGATTQDTQPDPVPTPPGGNK